jgi:hypothetical protein
MTSSLAVQVVNQPAGPVLTLPLVPLTEAKEEEEEEEVRKIASSGWGDEGGEVQASPRSSPGGVNEQGQGGSVQGSPPSGGKKRALGQAGGGEEEDSDEEMAPSKRVKQPHAFEYYIHFVHWDRRMDMWYKSATLARQTIAQILITSITILIVIIVIVIVIIITTTTMAITIIFPPLTGWTGSCSP